MLNLPPADSWQTWGLPMGWESTIFTGWGGREKVKLQWGPQVSFLEKVSSSVVSHYSNLIFQRLCHHFFCASSHPFLPARRRGAVAHSSPPVSIFSASCEANLVQVCTMLQETPYSMTGRSAFPSRLGSPCSRSKQELVLLSIGS